MLDLVDVQLQLGQVLAQLGVVGAVFDGILIVLHGARVVVVVDERLADLARQLAVLVLGLALVVGLLVVFDGLVGLADLHHGVAHEHEVAERPVLLQNVKEAHLVQAAVLDVRELHGGEPLLALDPDRAALVDVFEDVDGLLDLAEADAQFRVGDQQADLLATALELGDAVAHDGLGLLQPFLQGELLDELQGDAGSVLQCQSQAHLQRGKPSLLFLLLGRNVLVCLAQHHDRFVQLKLLLEHDGLHEHLQRTLFHLEVQTNGQVELCIGLLELVDADLCPCFEQSRLRVVPVLLELAERLDGLVEIAAVHVHQRQHQLRVLVARDELRDLVQDVLGLVQALREQRIRAFLRHQAQVRNAQVDQLVHQVYVQD